jgi:uncharacterized coiled-coil protein SlyX
MCFKIIQISILEGKIGILEGRIKGLESDILFEERQIEIMGESRSIDKSTAKLDQAKINLNLLKQKLVDIQYKTDVPSCLS